MRSGGLLTKKELAVELHRSERWVELRQREGLPVADTDRFGRRRYRLADVQAWLHEFSQRPRSTADRISALEAQVASLTATVEQLQRRTG
jgi:hypothetical protein